MDQERLATYVDSWRSAVDDVLVLLRSLDDADWKRPTDLPGWDVKAVAAHLAHIEADLADADRAVPEEPERSSVSPEYTERGVVARADTPADEIVEELEQAARRNHERLQADPPSDGKDRPPHSPGGTGWDWQTLLSNRVIDVWMHEQDIRRAVEQPGGMNTAAAAHTIEQLARGFGYVVGKRVAPPAGTTVVLDVSGVKPVHLAVEVNESGRAVPLTEQVLEPTVAMTMDVQSFIVLAGGRRTPDEVSVTVAGDETLARRVLESMAVTP